MAEYVLDEQREEIYLHNDVKNILESAPEVAQDWRIGADCVEGEIGFILGISSLEREPTGGVEHGLG